MRLPDLFLTKNGWIYRSKQYVKLPFLRQARMKRILLLIIVIASMNLTNGVVADEAPFDLDNYIKLKSYEPNIIAYKVDSNDVNFMDFKVSLMYPLWLGDHVIDPYFAVTGEFGQYIGTRDSSPVIAKRYNPKIFARYEIKGEGEKGREWEYFHLGYAHESNGQSINNATDYQNKRNDLIAHREDPDFARDYISRGWDYIDVMWKRNFDQGRYSTYLNVKQFLDNGLLQGNAEEYQAWEGSNGKARSDVDGVSLQVKRNFFDKPFGISKIAFTETTGIGEPFTYDSTRAEITFAFGKVPPIIFWVSEGYNNDLGDYYQRVTSIGLGLELTTN